MEWKKHRTIKYWKYREQWELFPKHQFVNTFPLCLDIETTNVCNLECVMCPRTIQIKEGSYGEIGTMSMDLYKKIIDEGAKYGLSSVKLNYLGEPLADKYIVERVRYAKEKGITDVMFNTNASLLTEAMTHKLLEAGLDSIFFSVDGIHGETFDKIRIGTNFKTVVENIINFIKIRNEKYPHVQTRVSMTMLPGMEKEAEQFKEFWLPIVGQVGYGEWVNHNEHGDYEYNPRFSCASPFQRMFIMWDGIVTPCCTDSRRSYVMGDIKTQTVREVWLGDKMRKLRHAQNNGKYRDIEICRNCYVPAATKG